MSAHISPELQKKIELMVESMPAFPRSVHKILDLTSDVNCAPKDVVEAIEHDPVMMGKILKLVNSAFYSMPRKVTSIKHAVIYMGMNTVKNMALSIATVGMLPKYNAARFDMSAFLLHSLVTGFVARKISEHIDRQEFDSIDFFVAGLLHDFGKVVLALSVPDLFAQALEMTKEGISLQQAEITMIGVDHSQVGAALGEKWNFPAPLVQAIAEHHQPELVSNILRDYVFAANQICKMKSIGYAGHDIVEPMSDLLMANLDGSLDTLLEKVGNLEPLIDEAKVFASL